MKKYIEFKTIEEAKIYGRKYFGSWLKDFQIGSEYRQIYSISDSIYDFFVMKHGKEKADILKEEVKIYRAFSYYCGGNYGLAINQLCRYGHQIFGFKDSIVKELIELMKKEILKYNIYENIIAFRVLDYNDLLNTVGTKKIILDQILTDNGFMGVGLVKDELIKEHSGYDTILQIYIPKECNGLYLDLISNRSEEQEILFFPGSRLKVLSNKKRFKKQRVIVCEMLY